MKWERLLGIAFYIPGLLGVTTLAYDIYNWEFLSPLMTSVQIGSSTVVVAGMWRYLRGHVKRIELLHGGTHLRIETFGSTGFGFFPTTVEVPVKLVTTRQTEQDDSQRRVAIASPGLHMAHVAGRFSGGPLTKPAEAFGGGSLAINAGETAIIPNPMILDAVLDGRPIVLPSSQPSEEQKQLTGYANPEAGVEYEAEYAAARFVGARADSNWEAKYWRIGTAEDGRVYYWNEISRQRRWNPPDVVMKFFGHGDEENEDR